MLHKAVFFFSLFLGSLYADQALQTPTQSPALHLEGVHPLSEPSMLAPSKEPSYEHAFLKMILTLGGLLFLVFFTLWAIRKLSNGRMGTFGSMKKIKILEKRPLSQKTVLYLLELDGKQVFIAESQLEVKKLLEPQEIEIE